MPDGRLRSVTLGSVGQMHQPAARREARRTLATLLAALAPGQGPRHPGRPMDAFAEEFLERHARYWKPGTPASNTYLLRTVILPVFAHLTEDAVEAAHVRDWFASLADRPGVANRSMPVLSVMMRMAELWGYRRHNTNPCRRIRRYRKAPKERYLIPAEIGRLNTVLTRDEFRCPDVVAALRLLLLTGCRAGEVLGLQ